MADAELPKFDEKKIYTLSGKTLNQIMAAIKARTILDSDSVQLERTAEGVRIKSV